MRIPNTEKFDVEMAAMSWLPHKPHYISLSLSSLQFPHSSFHFCIYPLTHPPFYTSQSSFLCLAASHKSRPSRKLMGDDELRSVLREFITTVGFPDDHVPSTKDLSRHGRKDLANIVRRRGHKLIKELLYNSAEKATDGFDSTLNLNSDTNEKNDHEITGQEGKLDDKIKEPWDIHVDVDETSFIPDGKSFVSKEPALTLQEKVENFMKYGQLDTVEDNIYGDSKFIDGNTILNHGKNRVVEGEQVMHSEGMIRHVAHVSNDSVGRNGSLMLPRLIASEAANKLSRDGNSSTQGLELIDLDNKLQIEAGKIENEIEINCLKHLLHQKELELSRLKEEVEKEKEALSVLQTKAENEITKAQKLILEKDAELLAAEESLSGLVEAKIQYSGEGEMVEVAGSFNGWHQRIKMDPQPSSVMIDPFESRKSRYWSTTLWLYPGTYEIKFIVDGHWKIDPQKETISKGGVDVENNILRVDR